MQIAIILQTLTSMEKKFKDGRIRRLKIAEGSVLTISVTISDYEKYTKFGTDGYTAEIIK